jgi:hypothetical protein
MIGDIAGLAASVIGLSECPHTPAGEPNFLPFLIPRKIRNLRFRKFDLMSRDRGVPTRVKEIRTRKPRKYIAGGCSDKRGDESAVPLPQLPAALPHTGGVNSRELREVREVRSWSPGVWRYAQTTLAPSSPLRPAQIWIISRGRPFPYPPKPKATPPEAVKPPPPPERGATPSTRGKIPT